MTDHPPPPPPPPYRSEPPPASKRGGCGRAALIGLAVIGGLVVLLIVLTIVGLAVSDDDDDTATDTTEATEGNGATEGPEAETEGEADEIDDVTLSECTTDPAGMVARLSVTNDSSQRSSYIIDVAFESPDGTEQFATGLAVINGLEPDQTTNSEAHSLTEATGEFECRIVEVDRTAT